MGFDTSKIISDERHYGAFLCAICTSLCGLDALVTSECSHVFCKSCLETWLHRSNTCPTCNLNLTFIGGPNRETSMIGNQALHALPLSKSQAVAYRVLSRIKVKCPLKVACDWQGDYGDLQAHLLSPSAHGIEAKADTHTTTNGDHDAVMGDDECDSTTLAESFKEEGNTMFSSGNLDQARQLYTKGISLLVDSSNKPSQLLAALYSNRATVTSKQNHFESCVEDCNKAIQIEKTYVKVYIKRARAQMNLGLFEDAVRGLDIGCKANKTSSILERELWKATEAQEKLHLGLQQMKDKLFVAAKTTFGTLLRESNSPRVIIAAARADLAMGLTESAERLSLQVARQHPQNADAYVVRGQCMYLTGEFDKAISLIREALRLDPDNERAKRQVRQLKRVKEVVQEARDRFFKRNFDQAVKSYGASLEACDPLPKRAPLYATLYTERAEGYLRLKDYPAALKDSSLVVYAREDFVKAWLIKIKAYHGLGRHEDARDELDDLLQKWGSNEPEIRNAWDKADFLVRKQKRPDYYHILGVSSIASLMEIKKQYKVKAKEYHPDRWTGAPTADQKNAEASFKLLGAALETLSDDFKRQLWDEGFDEDAIRERLAAAQSAAHRSQHYHRHGGSHH